MGWWKRWKAKYWDKRVIRDPPGQEVGLGWCEDVPTLRAWCEQAWADISAHRWAAFAIIGAIIAALLSRW